MAFLNKLFEGKYVYKNNGREYTEENFKVEKQSDLQGHMIFTSEVLSRVKTGEFLKLNITYEVTPHFDPVLVSVKRQLGAKESTETYKVDQKTKNIVYTFERDGQISRFEKVYTLKPHIAMPCFATSMIMVNQKKLDPVHRTQYTLLGTNNIWEYKAEPEEQTVFVEMEEIESVEIKINKTPLKAMHCKLLSVDANGAVAGHGHSIYLSKHYFLPYKADFNNGVIIEVQNLKDYESKIRANY